MPITWRVLVIEDSESDAILLARALRKEGYSIEFERVEDPVTMAAALKKQPWDVVTCDWAMPKFSAIAALDILAASGLDLPFIIVSGTIGEENAADAMRLGAHDYVLKDHISRLAPAIERELREARNRADHRRAELALRESEARFSSLFSSGIIGICIIDLFGRVHEVNDAILHMLGYSREELTDGRLWAELTPPEWKQADDLAIAQLRTADSPSAWEKEFIRKDGSRVAVLFGIATLTYPNCICFIADLTARKEAEKALRQSEAQFRQAQKMEAVGRLAGGVAHDFNNLLTVILNYSEILSRTLEPDDPLREDALEIKVAGERAAGLTRQLLAFSRRQTVEVRVINLNEVVKGMRKMLRHLVPENTELIEIVHPDVHGFRGDVGMIEQIIMNLVVNAADAMPDGGQLTIETANVTFSERFADKDMDLAVEPGEYVMLTVRDTGSGMDSETKARIFEPFFTTKERGKGTGLGLSTVFGIVKQFRGSIWVHSEPHRGTTFKIYFPKTADVLSSGARSALVVSTATGSETILLVEDEDQVRKVIHGVLRRYGYNVMDARNPAEAVVACEQHVGKIDLLLTDVIMPQMSGFDLAEKVLQLRPAIRVLFMSGYTDNLLLGQLPIKAQFLEKPLTADVLTQKVREVLDSPADQ